MPVTEVNGHVLLPHLPDWSRPVTWSRLWRTDVQRVLTGAEERRALRPKPRESLSWKLVPFDVTEQTPLLARLRAAAKSGLACAPYWGRGRRVVSAAATELVLEVEDEAWPWFEADDYLLLRSLEADAVEAFELVQAESVNGATFTLKAALAGTWPAGTWAWPLVFGRLTFSDLTHRTDWHAGVTVTLAELAVRPDPPSWVDICFLDPWGGCELWLNLAEGTVPVPDNAPDGSPGTGILYRGGTYVCLGEWQYRTWGIRGARSDWGLLADGSYGGETVSLTHDALHIEMPASILNLMANWVGQMWGWAGGWEDWSNLEDGDIGASWSAANHPVNADRPTPTLGTWAAAAW